MEKGTTKNLCNSCFSLIDNTLTKCPYCGFEIDTKKPYVKAIEDEAFCLSDSWELIKEIDHWKMAFAFIPMLITTICIALSLSAPYPSNFLGAIPESMIIAGAVALFIAYSSLSMRDFSQWSSEEAEFKSDWKDEFPELESKFKGTRKQPEELTLLSAFMGVLFASVAFLLILIERLL